MSAYNFMVTKFDLFLSKSQHSFHNSLIFHCYDLTFLFVVVFILQSPFIWLFTLLSHSLPFLFSLSLTTYRNMSGHKYFVFV